jgi:hypothetical protein
MPNAVFVSSGIGEPEHSTPWPPFPCRPRYRRSIAWPTRFPRPSTRSLQRVAQCCRLNIDRLKIDRAFVSGDDSRLGDYSIAEMVLKLADQLGLETIAEGIETTAQRDQMMSMGCGDGQGYLFSKPVTEDLFLSLVNRQFIIPQARWSPASPGQEGWWRRVQAAD